VELLEGCHEFLKEYKENGLQKAISAAMELANDQVKPEFQSVKTVRYKKRHFHYEGHDKPVKTSSKKSEIEFFNTLIDTAFISI
jgi:hypothetical protein